MITLLIQTTWNREGAALQAKLDGVIRALEEAETRFTGLEQRDDEDIAQFCAEHNELVAGEAECLSTGQGGACAAAV